MVKMIVADRCSVSDCNVLFPVTFAQLPVYPFLMKLSLAV